MNGITSTLPITPLTPATFEEQFHYLQQLYLTAAVHGDCLEHAVASMQKAVDEEQQQEQRLGQLEEECAAAHESLERITAMANTLAKGAGVASAMSGQPLRAEGGGTQNALSFAKMASSFVVGDVDDDAKPSSSSISSTSAHRISHANASVAQAQAHLASLRHQLATLEHSSIRRRLQSIASLKQRINKSMAEFISLYGCGGDREMLIDTRDARRGQGAMLAAIYPSTAASSPSPLNTMGGGGDAMDAILRVTLRSCRRTLYQCAKVIDALLRIVEEGPEVVEAEHFADDPLLSNLDVNANPWLRGLVGSSASAHKPNRMKGAPSASLISILDLAPDSTTSLFNACLLVNRLGESEAPLLSSRHGVDYKWHKALEEAVGGGDDKEGTGDNTVADHYEALMRCCGAKSRPRESERVSKKTSPPPSISISRNMRIPLPPSSPLMAALDAASFDATASPSVKENAPHSMMQGVPLTPSLPPARHILHHRFTFRNANELKRLTSAQMNIIRSHIDAVGRALGEGISERGQLNRPEEDHDRQRQQLIFKADVLRMKAAGVNDYRTWSAVSLPLPVSAEGSD